MFGSILSLLFTIKKDSKEWTLYMQVLIDIFSIPPSLRSNTLSSCLPEKKLNL